MISQNTNLAVARIWDYKIISMNAQCCSQVTKFDEFDLLCL
jgi:hypothetical protein